MSQGGVWPGLRGTGDRNPCVPIVPSSQMRPRTLLHLIRALLPAMTDMRINSARAYISLPTPVPYICSPHLPLRTPVPYICSLHLLPLRLLALTSAPYIYENPYACASTSAPYPSAPYACAPTCLLPTHLLPYACAPTSWLPTSCSLPPVPSWHLLRPYICSPYACALHLLPTSAPYACAPGCRDVPALFFSRPPRKTRIRNMELANDAITWTPTRLALGERV